MVNTRKAMAVPSKTMFLLWVMTLCLNAPCHAFQTLPKLGTFSTRSHSNPNAEKSTLAPHTITKTNDYRKTIDTSLSVASLPLLSSVGSPLGSVLVLAGVVLIHEAGHYLAARSMGIAVEEFSVGVGPKIVGFQAFGDEFNLRALPLGGYVRFPENYNSTLAQEMQEAFDEQRRAAAKEQGDNVKETTPIVAGLKNLLTLGGYERRLQQEQEELKRKQEEEAQKKVTFWSKLFGAGKATKPKEELKTPETFEIEYYDNPNLLQNRPWSQRAIVLSGGVIFNLLLAFSIFFGEIHVGKGLPMPTFAPGAVVSSIPRLDAPSKGILEMGDIIISVNGSPLSVSQSPNAIASQQAISDFIAKIRATDVGESLKLSVIRPAAASSGPIDLVVQPRGTLDGGPKSIGVLLRPNFVKTKLIRSDSIGEAASLAANSVTELTTETAKGLLTFFGALAKGKGAPAGQSVSGPIGLIRTGSDVVSTNDWTAILTFAAAISVNLAVVNALPLPALDGGQLAFVLAEAVTGRKVNQRVQEGITSVALIFLLLLSFGTTIGDVESLFRR